MQSSFVLSWNCQFHVQVKFTPVEDGLLNWTLLTSNHWHPSQSHGDGNCEACEVKFVKLRFILTRSVRIDEFHWDLALEEGCQRLGLNGTYFDTFCLWCGKCATPPPKLQTWSMHTLEYASRSFLMNWFFHTMITVWLETYYQFFRYVSVYCKWVGTRNCWCRQIGPTSVGCVCACRITIHAMVVYVFLPLAHCSTPFKKQHESTYVFQVSSKKTKVVEPTKN